MRTRNEIVEMLMATVSGPSIYLPRTAIQPGLGVLARNSRKSLQQPQLRKFRFERDSPPGGVAGSGSTRGQLFLQNPSASRLFCNQRAQVGDELGFADGLLKYDRAFYRWQ